MRERAPLELAWIEQDLALPWSWFETFLSILDFERKRDLAVASPHDNHASTMTADEAAVVGCLIFAPWSPRAARECLAPFLSHDSAVAAVHAAARVHASAMSDSGSKASVRVNAH